MAKVYRKPSFEAKSGRDIIPMVPLAAATLLKLRAAANNS
jgi:hypothetical protein